MQLLRQGQAMKCLSLMAFLALTIGACQSWKKLDFTERDSLLVKQRFLNDEALWQLKAKYTQLLDSSAARVLVVKADAPFSWSADGNLAGHAGEYRLYEFKNTKQARAKHEQAQGQVSHAESEKVRLQQHTGALNKQQEKTLASRKIVLALLFLAVVVALLCMGRFYLWKFLC